MPLRYFILVIFPLTIACHSKKNELQLFHGTAGIIFTSPDSIWFAMDSKVSGDSTFNELKIGNTGSIFYSFAGLPKVSQNGKEIFNSFELMKNCIKRNHDFLSAFNLFNDSVTIYLRAIFEYLYKTQKKDFYNYYNVNKHVLEYAMASFVDSFPKAILRTYRLTGEKESNWIIVSDTTIYNIISVSMILIGHPDSLYSFLLKNRSFLAGFKNEEEKLACLIKIEADNNSLVGLPINEAVIYKSGHKWYKNVKVPNAFCP